MAVTRTEIERLTAEERAEIARILVELGNADAVLPPGARRRRRLLITLVAVCTVLLTGWIVALGITLSPNQLSHHWRLAWVGFDAFELVGFLVTCWAVVRSRQLLIPAATVTGTLLFCDAWFDVVLSWDTPDRVGSILSAVLVEIPLGVLLWLVARRLIMLTLLTARARLGLAGVVPPLRRARLLSPIGAPTDAPAPTRHPDAPSATGSAGAAPSRPAPGRPRP